MILPVEFWTTRKHALIHSSLDLSFGSPQYATILWCMPAGIAASAERSAAHEQIIQEFRFVLLRGAKSNRPLSHEMPASKREEKFFSGLPMCDQIIFELI